MFLGFWSNSIARDSALRPHTITTPAGAFTYAYKGAGMTLESLIMPGSTNLYEYDDAGMLQALTAKNSANATVDHHGYDRDANGQITKVYRMAGITADYDYDGIGQLLFVHGHESDTTLRLNENIDYGYDASGNLKGRTNNTLTQVFTSDAADQLLNITRGGTLTVVGSVAGAVATLGVNGTNAALYGDNTFATSNGLALHDGNNLFVTAGSNGAGALVVSTINPTRLPVSVNLTYDHDGNLLSDGLKNYTYDEIGQLASISVAHQWRTEFVYDALGRRRVAKDYGWSGGGWTKTNETRYVYDRMAILQERDGSNAVKVTYSRGLDLSGSFQGAGGIGGLLARTDASGSVYYHADQGGNITLLTDSSGDVVARYLYDPFGTVLGKWGAMADVNTMQFSSMPRHANSGLSLYAFRAYDPSLQRWTQRDPIGEMGGINLYGFVGNDPANQVDPFGLDNPNPTPEQMHANSVNNAPVNTIITLENGMERVPPTMQPIGSIPDFGPKYRPNGTYRVSGELGPGDPLFPMAFMGAMELASWAGPEAILSGMAKLAKLARCLRATKGLGNQNPLFKEALSPFNEDFTQAGRAVTKHPEYFGFNDLKSLQKVYNTPEKINELAAETLKDIIRNGDVTSGAGGRYPGGWQTYTLPNGTAASWHSGGDFIGFRGPRP